MPTRVRGRSEEIAVAKEMITGRRVVLNNGLALMTSYSVLSRDDTETVSAGDGLGDSVALAAPRAKLGMKNALI